jgi:hypothetical protein
MFSTVLLLCVITDLIVKLEFVVIAVMQSRGHASDSVLARKKLFKRH